MLSSSEATLWNLITSQFRLAPHSVHGPGHWLRVRQNGLYLARFLPADPAVIKPFAVFHDSCRWAESRDAQHGPRGARLAEEFRRLGRFQSDDLQMQLLMTACEIHNGAAPQLEPTLAVCLDADRLNLCRVGILPEQSRLSPHTAKSIANRKSWQELG